MSDYRAIGEAASKVVGKNTERYIDALDLSNVNGGRDPNSIVLTLKLPIVDG